MTLAFKGIIPPKEWMHDDTIKTIHNECLSHLIKCCKNTIEEREDTCTVCLENGK